MRLVIRAEEVRKSHGQGEGLRAALDGVSLTIEPGELVCIVGPSGSGKSTLLGILGGLDLEFQGKVELFGKDIHKLGDRALARLRNENIGFIFQAFHLLSHLSVLDNVLAPSLFAAAFPLMGKPVTHAETRDPAARARALLKRLGIADRANDTPAQLSGGQRQRVAIARALLLNPTLILCDEPTGNLDTETGAKTIDLFKELHAEGGLTLVVVTHEERLARIATRIIELRDGRISDRSPEAVHEPRSDGDDLLVGATPARAADRADEAEEDGARRSTENEAGAPNEHLPVRAKESL